jgi:magnesium-transporting ATPase (P-type)
MTLTRRVLMVAAVLVAMVQPAICGYYAYLLWQYQSAGHQTDEGIAANIHLAELLAALALLDLIAVMVFVLRSNSYGWCILAAVQIADPFAVWLVASPTWDPSGARFVLSLCAGAGAVTTALLLVFILKARFPRSRLTPP